MEIDANFMAMLATRNDLVPLATKEELAKAIALLAERLEHSIDVIAEGCSRGTGFFF